MIRYYPQNQVGEYSETKNQNQIQNLTEVREECEA